MLKPCCGMPLVMASTAVAPVTEPPVDADESLDELPPDTLTTMATTTTMMATTAAPLISHALRDIRVILRSGTAWMIADS